MKPDPRALSDSEQRACQAFGEAVARLRGVRTQEQIAEEIGVSQGMVWQWANGKRAIPAIRAAAAASAVGVDDPGEISAEWRETIAQHSPGLEVMQPAVPAELVFVTKVVGASLSAGLGELLWDFEQVDRSHAFRLDWMQSKGLRADKCKVWTVRGESMEPKYPGGSWVLINMAERTPVHGKNFALIGDDGLRLKQLRRTAAGGWEMYSLNPDKDRFPTEPIVEDNYAIIGRVRGHGGDDD